MDKHNARAAQLHACTIAVNGFTHQRPARHPDAQGATATVALAAEGFCTAVSDSGRCGYFFARTANHGFYFDGRMGSGPQFARAVSMALASPSLRPHAAQLGQWWLREPQIQMERHPDDRTEHHHSVIHSSAPLGSGAC